MVKKYHQSHQLISEINWVIRKFETLDSCSVCQCIRSLHFFLYLFILPSLNSHWWLKFVNRISYLVLLPPFLCLNTLSSVGLLIPLTLPTSVWALDEARFTANTTATMASIVCREIPLWDHIFAEARPKRQTMCSNADWDSSFTSLPLSACFYSSSVQLKHVYVVQLLIR